MIRLHTYGFLASLILLIASCGSGLEWTHYNTPEFSIDFPHAPKDTATLGFGGPAVKVFLEPSESQPDENAYYEISVSKADVDLTTFHDTVFYKSLAAEAKVNALMMGGYVLDEGTKVTCGKWKGIEFKIAMGRKGDGTITLRKIATPTHIFTLKVITTAARTGNAYIGKFMNSLVIKSLPAAPKK